MKHFFLITCLLIFMGLRAQIVPIPDFYFKAELLIHDPVIDLNGDGEIQVSEAEVTISIDVSFAPGHFIYSIEGIEYFTNLESLDVGHHETLEYMDISQNTKLTYLNCSYAGLTSLDISQNIELRELFCTDSPIGTLDISHNPMLEIVFCLDCDLNSVIVGDNEVLRTLYLPENQITGNLFLSHLSSLNVLNLGSNQLSGLDIQNGNNHQMGEMVASGNPDLLCIQVDNENASYPICNNGSPGWCKDPNAVYRESCTFGLEDNAVNSFVLLPNPTTGIINFNHTNANLNAITVYSISGRKLLHRSLVTNSLDISFLKNGMYFFELTSNRGKEVHKVLKY